MKMKTSTLFFSLCFSLCYFALPIPSVLAHELVYDTSGNPLKPNAFYEIQSGSKMIGEGIHEWILSLVDDPTRGIYFMFIPQDQTTTQISTITRFTITIGKGMSAVLTTSLDNCNPFFKLRKNAPDPAVFSISNTGSGYFLQLLGVKDENNNTVVNARNVQTGLTNDLLKVKGGESCPPLVDLLPLTFEPAQLVYDSKDNPLQPHDFYNIRSGSEGLCVDPTDNSLHLVSTPTDELKFKFNLLDQTTQISEISSFTITTDNGMPVAVGYSPDDIMNPWLKLATNGLEESADFFILESEYGYNLVLCWTIQQNNTLNEYEKMVQKDLTTGMLKLNVEGAGEKPSHHLVDIDFTFEPTKRN